MIERDLSKYAIIAIIVIALGGTVYQGMQEGKQGGLLPAGSPAPEMKAERYGGGALALSGLRGKVVMLDFWATWCGPCVAEMPYLLKLAQEYQAKGLTFVAANSDDPDTAKVEVGLFVTDRVPGLGPHVVFPEAAAAGAFRAHMLPTLYLIDRQGKVISGDVGQQSESALRSRIEAALAQ